MYLIDHNNPTWQKRVRRINGAFTYSQDLVKYQIPKWEALLTDNDIISTCPKLSEVEIGTDRVEFNTTIQYLHSYPYSNPVERAKHVKHNLPFKTKQVIFVTAYRDYTHLLRTYGMNAIFCPMGIDLQEVRKYQEGKIHSNRIIYFGNVVQNKSAVFAKLKLECKTAGLQFDYISNGRLNGITPVTHEEALSLVSQYEYGIGVGRCAQELMALGVKILIAGHKFGGIITNQLEASQQLSTNMNGRFITYNPNIRKCIQDIDKAILVTNDIANEDHTKAINESKIRI